MKLTINIDDALLDTVVRITGASTKTEAITTALKEVERKAKLVEVLRAGTGASPKERIPLRSSVTTPNPETSPPAA